MSAVMSLWVPYIAGNFLFRQKSVAYSRRTLLHGVGTIFTPPLHHSYTTVAVPTLHHFYITLAIHPIILDTIVILLKLCRYVILFSLSCVLSEFVTE